MPQLTRKIATHLCFNSHAEEAVHLYCSIFNDSRIIQKTYCGEGEHAPPGSLRTITFELCGQKYWAVNGGPHFKFTDGISLYVSCESQAEIDDLWQKFSAGGVPSDCGWVEDRFGMFWQISSTSIDEMINDPDPIKSSRAVRAILSMQKLDIEGVRKAWEG